MSSIIPLGYLRGEIFPPSTARSAKPTLASLGQVGPAPPYLAVVETPASPEDIINHLTLHPPLFTLHSLLFTLHPPLFTLYSSPFTLHSLLFTNITLPEQEANRKDFRI